MTICPKCGNDYQRIGQHWSNSSTCGYPRPSADEKDLFIGLWLAGATIHVTGKRPLLTKTSKHKAAMEWVADEANHWHSSLTETEKGSPTDSFEQEFEHKHSQWRWNSAKCPWLQHLNDASLTDDVVDYSPRAARVFTSFRGSINNSGTLCLWHRDGPSLSEILADQGFDTTVSEYDGRSDIITILDDSKVDYLEWIGEPIPGVSEKFRV